MVSYEADHAGFRPRITYEPADPGAHPPHPPSPEYDVHAPIEIVKVMPDPHLFVPPHGDPDHYAPPPHFEPHPPH